MRSLVLLLADIFALWVSHLLAWWLRFRALAFLFPAGFVYAQGMFRPLWLPLIFLFFFWSASLYSHRFPFWEETKRLWKAIVMASLAVFAVISLGRMSEEVSRTVLLLTSMLAMVLLPSLRVLAEMLMWAVPVFRRKVLIVGAGEMGRLVKRSLDQEKTFAYEVVGFLDDQLPVGSEVEGKKVLGRFADMDRVLVPTMEAIVALPELPPRRLVGLVNRLQKRVRQVAFLPDLAEVPLFEGEMEFFVGTQMPLLVVRNNLKRAVNRWLKRLFDLAVSLLLLPFLLPLFVLIGLGVKVSSPGPVFYAQTRVGQGGRPFHCLKFRTMYVDAEKRLREILAKDKVLRQEWRRSYKLKSDPRVTPLGRFLRRTSLDELPQFFNILKGEMSLVGPRPVLAEELRRHYGNYREFYEEVRPGLTGLWQISGRNDVDYRRRVKLDVWYVSNWSLWLDVIILVQTVRVVLARKGAY